ncbi:hypothetical protein [Nitrosarchaeum sp.]|uniref:hypothetical protein n=1 Tax=Nitrosarchaeum sp. TaxID=2026886 RepID=UPI00247BDEB8|nr:hypothetical protein [Nitrosarchaeum sp.]MCV0411395.1 hypothetical protein [Nitrosarchaeum sp.]
MDDDKKRKELVCKIRAFSYRQLYSQFVIEIVKMECDIKYIFELFKEIEKFDLLPIYSDGMVKSSKIRFAQLKHLLRIFEEKRTIPEEEVAYHRKQIQKFDDDFAEIDKINRERPKSDFI